MAAAAAGISFSRILRPTPPKFLPHLSIPPSRLLLSSLSPFRNPPLLRFSAQENNGVTEETLADKKEETKLAEADKEEPSSEMLGARKERSMVEEMVGGVAEEIKEIEWPEFRKVVSITGVVLSVIAGSSVVLLTVNAILAELSDRVFVGKGVQDFFSG